MSQTIDTALKGGRFLVDEVDSGEIVTPEDLTDEHRLIAKTTEDFVTTEVMPKLEALERHDFHQATALFRKAGELGLLGADVPEKYGGIGLDQLSSAVITEKFSTAEGFAVAHNIHVGVGTLPYVYFGDEHQKQKYLPSLATGQKIAAYALTEPGSGSDALSAKTTATLNEDGTHYLLNGEKQWITNAAIADVFVVFAKVDRKDFTAFIVERDFKGVSIGPEEKKMGIHSCSTATLILDEVKVPKENVIGEIGKGHLVALNILNIARYKLGLIGIGQAKKAFRLAVKYAKERRQFQQPISSFPLIQEKLANMAVHIYAAESAVYRTCGLLEKQLADVSKGVEKNHNDMAASLAENLIECSVSKFYASEMLDRVVDEALQIHGGYGFMSEYEIETMYRDSRIDRIFEGTNEINRMAAGRALIKKVQKEGLFSDEKPLTWQGERKDRFEESPSSRVGQLAFEEHILKTAKRLFRLIFESTFKKYDGTLDKEQEVLSNLADMVSEIYAMDSVIRRTQKAVHGQGADGNQQKIRLTEVFCYESFERIVSYAKQILGRVEKGENLKKIYSNFVKLTYHTPINAIEKKRQIAAKLIEKEEYTV